MYIVTLEGVRSEEVGADVQSALFTGLAEGTTYT